MRGGHATVARCQDEGRCYAGAMSASNTPHLAELPVASDPAIRLAFLEPDYARRFGALARLYGEAGLARLSAAHVCVIGLGGVGSWVAEALARSAIGQLTLIDLDHVSESNINRQVHANDVTLGQAKVQAMAERIAGFHPRCVVHAVEEFVEPDNLAQLLPVDATADRFDYVVDAMDSVRAKVALIVWCRDHGMPLVTVGAAGGQCDPTRVRIGDLAHTEHEPLLARVRKQLRREHGFSRNIRQRFGIDAVYSDEPLVTPDEACATDGPLSREASEAEGGMTGLSGLNCAGFGSSVAVTGVFGLMAAGQVLNRLARPVTPATISAACAPSR